MTAPTNAIALNALTPDAVLTRLRWRYAAKKFDPTRGISAQTMAALEQALVLTPSSFGLQPWKFVIIADPAVKAKLPAISWNQPQPRDCSHFIVLAARTGIGPADVDRWVARLAEARAIHADSLRDYKAMMLGTITGTPPARLDDWCARQCYIALGFLLSAAAMLGIDACPMEGIVTEEYDKLLKLPESGYTSIVGCALGFRARTDPFASMIKARFPGDQVIQRI